MRYRRRRPATLLLAAATTSAVPAAAGRAATGPTLTTLVGLTGGNGGGPACDLVADAAGNLYGSTTYGGAGGYGTVFKVAAGSRALTTLASFDGVVANNSHGAVLFDAAGTLYGTTVNGGATNKGTLFAVPAGATTATVLASFGPAAGVGAYPNAPLVAGPNGLLYGTTYYGTGVGSYGTVFAYDPAAGRVTTVTSFDQAHGNGPLAGLTVDAAGDLFGTASSGGNLTLNQGYGDGTLFEIPAGGHTPTTLVAFNGSNGNQPVARPVFDAAGNLYGTTERGGTNNLGTVYEVAAGTGRLTTLASFNGSNGQYPLGDLLVDAAGDLFGTTLSGGSAGRSSSGTVFEVAAGSGAATALYTFTNANGNNPEAGLIADAAGNLYGTTNGGGPGLNGTVFELSNAGFVTAVPEPAAAGLVAAAGLGLCRRRRSPTPFTPE